MRLGKVWGGRAQSPVPASHGPAHPTYRPLCSGKVPRALGAATATDPRTRARSGPRRGLLHSENRDLNKRSSESEASPPSACPAAAPCRPHHGLCWPRGTSKPRRVGGIHRPPAARRSPALDDLHGLVWKAWRRCRGVGAPPLRAPVRHARSRCGEGTIDALSTDSRAEAHLHHPCLFRPAAWRAWHASRHMAFAQFAPVRKVRKLKIGLRYGIASSAAVRTRQVAALSRGARDSCQAHRATTQSPGPREPSPLRR